MENTQPTLSVAMRRVLKARAAVVERVDYFGAIIYSMGLVETDQVPTMATDGFNVYFNTQFVEEEENADYVEGVLFHEYLHPALGHNERQENRNHEMWNEACDHPVNKIVKRFFPLPVDPKWQGLDDPRFDGMNAERVYSVIERERKKQGNQAGNNQSNKSQAGQDDDPASDGTSDSGDNSKSSNLGNEDASKPKSGQMIQLTKEQREEAAEKMRQAINQARSKAEKAGHLEGSIIEEIIESRNPTPKIDWRKRLDQWAHDAKSNVETSWSRPNRRYMGMGMILPGPVNDIARRLVVCLDVSGSVDNNQHREMKEEVASLLEMNLVTHVTLISTDTAVCNMADCSTPAEVRAFKGKGGGGTRFDAAMEQVKKVPDAIGCIFLTDMQTESFGQNPGMPVLWVDWLRICPKAPFGAVAAY